MISLNVSAIAVLNIKGSDYCCNVCGISETEATKLLQNIDLTEKNGIL